MQKCATNVATDEIDDHRIQFDYKCIIGLQNSRGKNSVLGIASSWWNWARHQWQHDHQGYCVFVVKPSTTPMTTWPSRVLRLRGEYEQDTNDNVTTKIQTDFDADHMKLYTWHQRVFSFFVCLVSFCLRQHIHELHTTSRGSMLKGVAHVISSMHQICGSPSTLISIPFHFFVFQFIINLLHFILHFFHNHEGRLQHCVLRQKGDGLSWRLILHHRLWAQILRRQGETCRVLHSSPSKGSSMTWSTMTPHSRICFTKHTEYMSNTPSETACLSVSRRRPWPSERGRSVGERTGRPFGPCQAEIKKQEFQADLTEEVHENWAKLLILSKKNFIALKLKNFNDEMNNFFMDGYCSRIRNYAELIPKVPTKWED